MGTMTGRRGAIVAALGVCLLLLFLGLGTLNAFNLRTLDPSSPLLILVLVAVSTVAFLLFVGVLVLLVRNVLKLYADQRSRVLGTRLRTRMLWGAVLVSLVPLVFMFSFSYLLLNRAVDRWFSQPVNQMREDANSMAVQLFHYAAQNSRSEARSIAASLGDPAAGYKEKPVSGLRAAVHHEFVRHEATLQGGFAIFYRNGQPIASYHAPAPQAPNASIKSLRQTPTPVDDLETEPALLEVTMTGVDHHALLQAAQRGNDPVYALDGTDYTLATAGLKHGDVVLVGLPIPAGITSASQRLRTSADSYWVLFRERRQIRTLYVVLLMLITVLALFVCCWLALNLSKQVTRPVESLAEAMEAIAAGDYARRVGESATEELGELVDSFNAMATDLESSRAVAEQSTLALSELNTVLSARRTELETIIETIPNGVVTLSPSRRLVLANRAFSETLDPGGQKAFIGLQLQEIFPADLQDTLDHLLRRSHRMGTASSELQMPSASGVLQLAVTVALLETGSADAREHLGYVVVFEDVTELLHAQKQSAWKEVARRVAHEIKNPLTPISLNAELIQRHAGRLSAQLQQDGVESRAPGVIQRSSEIISSSVDTLRSLVDQFSALAEFPSARPQPADLNGIVESSLAFFTGRLGQIRVIRKLAPALPEVLADPVALKRALNNLIDNAAEAMQDSLLRELHISTQLLDSGMVELTVADTGPGVTDDTRERLFLPYFSTKQRGTGLGLSIAAKIVQELQGSIRAEKNVPAGARFIIELKTAAAGDSESLDMGADRKPKEQGVSA